MAVGLGARPGASVRFSSARQQGPRRQRLMSSSPAGAAPGGGSQSRRTAAIMLQVWCRFLENSHSDLLPAGAEGCSLWEQLFWAGSFSLLTLNSVDVMKGLIQEL